MTMKYFSDITFSLAMEIRDCFIEVDTVIEEYYSIELIAGGSMHYARDAESSVALAAPCLHWHAPGHRYRYGPAEGAGRWHHLFVTFAGPRAERLVRTGLDSLSGSGYCVLADLSRVVHPFRELIHRVTRRSPGYQGECCVLLEQLLCLLQREIHSTPHEPDHRQMIEWVLDRIHREPSRKSTAEAMAESIGLSVSHFRRIFRAQLGQPFHAYLIESLMHHAIECMMNPNRSIQDIAQKLGYEELSDFSRTFRRVIGVSPRRYRQTLEMPWP
jgi:AraC-like DNA-binding protein